MIYDELLRAPSLFLFPLGRVLRVLYFPSAVFFVVSVAVPAV